MKKDINIQINNTTNTETNHRALAIQDQEFVAMNRAKIIAIMTETKCNFSEALQKLQAFSAKSVWENFTN